MLNLVYSVQGCSVYCRAVTDVPVAVRRCVMCFQPAMAHRVVEVSPEDTPIWDHVTTCDIFAQILFTNYVPIHGRCLVEWSDALIRNGRSPHSWRTHCRCYTPAHVRWYRDLIAYIDTQNARALAHWPLPSAQRKPRPQELVGYLFHTTILLTLKHRISLRRVTAPTCYGLSATEEQIHQSWPDITIEDRGIFTAEGMPVTLLA